MKTLYLLAFALATPALGSTPLTPPPSAPAQAAGYSVEATPLGAMLDDPAAKEVLAKHVPAIVGSDQVQMARGMTLKQLQQYAGDMLSDAKLAEIQADLARLAPKK